MKKTTTPVAQKPSKEQKGFIAPFYSERFLDTKAAGSARLTTATAQTFFDDSNDFDQNIKGARIVGLETYVNAYNEDVFLMAALPPYDEAPGVREFLKEGLISLSVDGQEIFKNRFLSDISEEIIPVNIVPETKMEMSYTGPARDIDSQHLINTNVTFKLHLVPA